MNQTQIKYARQRLEKIYGEKRRAIEARYKQTGWSFEQLIDFLKAGDFTVTGDRGYWAYNIKFPDPEQPDLEAKKAEFEKLDKAFERTMDELIIGDSDLALELIKSFEAL